MGSGCGSGGRVVTADSRGPRVESSQQQNFILNVNCIENTKLKKKFCTKVENENTIETSDT